MKAKILAYMLSLLVVSIPLHAANSPNSQMKPAQTVAKIDLNKAEPKDLVKSVKGLGQKRAEAIVKFREEQGKFNSIEDLAKVKGIGKRFVEKHMSELEEAFTAN